MSGHTPTPWTCRPRHFDDWGFIRGADGQLACIARGHSEKEFDQHRIDKTDPYQANAAFIVKAVNNHTALVKALEFIRDGGVTKPWTPETFEEAARRTAREALIPVGRPLTSPEGTS